MILKDEAVVFLATGFYVGNIPFAPGTLGSLLGLPLCFLLSGINLQPAFVLALIIIIFAAWIAHVAEKILKQKDPGCIVIDEIAGMVVAFIGLPFNLTSMNCPFHVQIYKSRTRSYRDLPLRFAEWGTVYRYERSGVVHGLLRVRGFTQDDAHLFCKPDQMPEEIDRVLEFSLNILRAFGFEDFQAYLSTRNPEKAAGSAEDWEAPTEALRNSLERSGVPYKIDEGEAVFYGPKIDIKVNDALGREWQLSTIQFDFTLPERFDLTYVGEDGNEHRPYMIHRALLGSMERFMGVLIEHFAGAFPVWLAPQQAVLIPIADRHTEYSQSVADRMREVGLRVEVDERSERMNAKIRDAQLQKIPYMLVVGDREMEADSVSVRLRSEEDLGAMQVASVIERMQGEVSKYL